MTARIVATQPFGKQILEMWAEGISYTEVRGLGGMGDTFHHTFAEIDAVLASQDTPVLSIQAGGEVYSIHYDAYDPDHQEVLQAILDGVRATMPSA